MLKKSIPFLKVECGDVTTNRHRVSQKRMYKVLPTKIKNAYTEIVAQSIGACIFRTAGDILLRKFILVQK